MPLEDLTGPGKYIGDLVREWPLGIDPFAEGDDHLRGIKNVLRNSFPTISEARRPVSFREGATKAEELAGAMELPNGSDAQRPLSPVVYDIRVNDTGRLEWWNGAAWAPAVSMLAEDNVRIGASNTPGSPVDKWASDRTPSAGDTGPVLEFEIGNGPGGVPMGAILWQVSPDDPTRMRMAIRRENANPGNGLIVGDGVMVPGVDNPSDSFDPGRGWLNVDKGIQIQGQPQYGAVAWALFNGETGAFIEGKNVSQTQRTALGRYLITFENALPSSDYSYNLTPRRNNDNLNAVNVMYPMLSDIKTATQFAFRGVALSNSIAPTYIDPIEISVQVFL